VSVVKAQYDFDNDFRQMSEIVKDLSGLQFESCTLTAPITKSYGASDKFATIAKEVCVWLLSCK